VLLKHEVRANPRPPGEAQVCDAMVKTWRGCPGVRGI
jgi:hypothetical protein